MPTRQNMTNAELLKLGRQERRLADRIKKLEDERKAIKDEIDAEVEAQGIDTIEGNGVRIHGVQNEYVNYNTEMLRENLTPREFKSVLADPSVDKKKLADAVAAGRIDPEKVAPAADYGYSKVFARITRL